MNYSKLMKERIQRVSVIFKELGFSFEAITKDDQAFSATFKNTKNEFGECFIDADNKFLEMAFSFSFPAAFSGFLQLKLPEVMRTSYEYGCYLNLQYDSGLTLSVFSKIYFAGLNYYALKETLRDFNGCVLSLSEILELKKENAGHEDS
ncbi:MAG: hypothetical protein JXB03_10920 [Spirochaetales bacterium]|nr:hypothetical protein [Spirochaetales bacterium]